MNPEGTVRPRPIRFTPDPLDHALVAFDGLADQFRPEIIAIIYDEAPLNGCGLVMLDHPRIEPDALCVVKVGRMDPVAARVVWKRELKPKLVQVGFEYLD